MANQPQRRIPQNRAASSAKSRSGWAGFMIGVFLLSIILMVLAPAILPVFIIGMAPTFVALLSDQDQYRFYRVSTVALFNLAGVIPVVAELWAAGRGFPVALRMLSDVYNWLLMYGSAGFALAALALAPNVSANINGMVMRGKLSRVNQQQEELVANFGEEVAPSQNPDPDNDDEAAAKHAAQ